MNLLLVLAWVALIATVSVSAKDQGLRGRDLEVHNEPDASEYFEGEENLLSPEEMDEMGLEEQEERDLSLSYGTGYGRGVSGSYTGLAGYGSGYGGYGRNYGNGYGRNYGNGYGSSGYGSGYGTSGYGSGYGGYGRGSGYGSSGYGSGYGGYGSGYGSSGY